jgi:hypothetical protein
MSGFRVNVWLSRAFAQVANAANRLYQLTADWNGDEAVSILDFSAFAYWFGVELPAAPSYVDISGMNRCNARRFASRP